MFEVNPLPPSHLSIFAAATFLLGSFILASVSVVSVVVVASSEAAPTFAPPAAHWLVAAASVGRHTSVP